MIPFRPSSKLPAQVRMRQPNHADIRPGWLSRFRSRGPRHLVFHVECRPHDGEPGLNNIP